MLCRNVKNRSQQMFLPIGCSVVVYGSDKIQYFYINNCIFCFYSTSGLVFAYNAV